MQCDANQSPSCSCRLQDWCQEEPQPAETRISALVQQAGYVGFNAAGEPALLQCLACVSGVNIPGPFVGTNPHCAVRMSWKRPRQQSKVSAQTSAGSARVHTKGASIFGSPQSFLLQAHLHLGFLWLLGVFWGPRACHGVWRWLQ